MKQNETDFYNTPEEDLPFSSQEDALLLYYDNDEEDESLYKTKGKWAEAQKQLNQWGYVFSTGTPEQRLVATDRIMHIFDQITYRFCNCENEALYNNAVKAMREHFIGETAHPIRFLKHVYPEEVFNNAILYTLGFSTSESGSDISKNPHAYDASKGATYVTYFSRILEFFCKSRRRTLNNKNKRLPSVQMDDNNENNIPSQESSVETQVIEENSNHQAALLVNLASLVADKLQLDKMLPIGDDAENKPKNLKASTLQLFYSFQLVNFSRFATSPVSRKEDKVLIGAADQNFLTFSTTMQAPAYQALILAELSSYVLENKLYCEENHKKILMQRAAAHYRSVSESTLSPQFEAAQRYLKKHWKYI